MRIGSYGFSLVETLASVVILSVTILSIITTLSHRLQVQGLLNTRANIAQADALIDGILSSPPLCDCLLSNADNPSMVVPANTAGVSLNVGEIRSSCDFSRTDNLPAREGLDLVPGVPVSSILLKNIAATGIPNQYTGIVEVTLDSGISRPLNSHVAFQIDPVTRRPLRCVFSTPQSLGIMVCPPGFLLIGNPGDADSYCIENNQRAPVTFQNARQICDSIRPVGFNPGRLCYTWDLRRACLANHLHGPVDEEYSAEITPDGAGNVHGVKINIRAATDCAPNWTAGPPHLTPGAFRCCIN